MKQEKAAVVQSILGQWHVFIANHDFWPRATHQKLIDATVTVLPEATRFEKAEHRVLAVEALHHSLSGKAKSIQGRIANVEEWLNSKPAPDVIAAKFAEAARYASAY
jgi:hypothetical protein